MVFERLVGQSCKKGKWHEFQCNWEDTHAPPLVLSPLGWESVTTLSL